MDALQQQQRAAVQQHQYEHAQLLQHKLRTHRAALDALELQVAEAFSQADRTAQLELQLAVDKVRAAGWCVWAVRCGLGCCVWLAACCLRARS